MTCRSLISIVVWCMAVSRTIRSHLLSSHKGDLSHIDLNHIKNYSISPLGQGCPRLKVSFNKTDCNDIDWNFVESETNPDNASDLISNQSNIHKLRILYRKFYKQPQTVDMMDLKKADMVQFNLIMLQTKYQLNSTYIRGEIFTKIDRHTCRQS